MIIALILILTTLSLITSCKIIHKNELCVLGYKYLLRLCDSVNYDKFKTFISSFIENDKTINNKVFKLGIFISESNLSLEELEKKHLECIINKEKFYE